MSIMVSYNIACKEKKPKFYEEVDIIRMNSPWYTKEEMEHIFLTEQKPKFLDVNITKRTKAMKEEHDYKELLKLAGKYEIQWVAISNVENTSTYDEVRKLLGQDRTMICAKIESKEGCLNSTNIIKTFDGIMVDVEDLASEVGWEEAVEEKERIYEACVQLGKDHFNLMGVIFEHIRRSRIVYTYGVFDLLHPGHIKILETAKSLGDHLFVGVVKDEAVRKLKGKDRPIQPFQDRFDIIKSLKCVDVVLPQEDYDPVPNLKQIVPDVLVKGDDWKHIPGEEWIREHGGTLVKPAYSPGWSTSGTVKKIRGEK